MQEEWRAVVGYAGKYKVSNMGQVRSIKYREPRLLKPTLTKRGYLRIGLCRNGSTANLYIHRMVLAAFRGPCPEGLEAAHLNGKRNDPRLENLIWTTRKDNHSHKERHGTAQRGEKNGIHRLTEAQVLGIRRMHAEGGTLKGIGAKFGCGATTAADIIHRKSWRHI